METVDNRSMKEKVRDFWWKTKMKAEDAGRSVKKVVTEHPMETFTVICLAVPGVLKCVNSGIRAHQQNMETRYNECDQYDPRTGTHYFTRKPLTNNQKVYLEQEYKSGRSKGEILKEMKMI